MRTASLRLPRMFSARGAAGLSALHLLLALLYKHGVGIDIEADPTMTWDWLWQALPAEALRTDLWMSLWNLHSQPPFFNLYGALLLRLSPAHHLQLMHYANILLGSLLICLVPAGWYAKNLAKFGFFGSSSWYGMNLWNAVSFRYAKPDLMRFVEEGVLDPVAADVVTEHKRSFFRPSAYEKHGFDRKAEELVLSWDDYNNINIPDVSRAYFRNALRILRRDAAHYLWNVGWAYRQYASPPFRDPHHTKNIQKLPMHIHEFLYYRLLEGQWAANRIGERLGERSLGSFYFLLIPLGLVAYAIPLVRSCERDPRRWARRLQEDAPMAFTMLLVIYTTVVGCTFEINENARFRFLVSPIFLAFLVVLGSRILAGRTSARR